MANIMKIIMGILWFILAAVFTLKTYYIVPVIYEQMPITFLQVLFWIGLIIVWSLYQVIVPIYIVMQGYNDE